MGRIKMQLPEILDLLRNVAFQSYHDSEIKTQLTRLKSDFVKQGLEDKANEIWCIESILNIQTTYLKAFTQLKNQKYYEAWCSFEQVELALNFLAPHFDINSDEYKLSFIEKHTKKYQSLYPYKIFMSPEILEKEKKCNICNRVVSIRRPCGHEVGNLYNGQMCCRIVTDMELLGIAMVETPLQKYSVPFLSDEKTGKSIDHYDYSLLKYLIKRITGPFEDWDYELTSKVYSHNHFSNVGRNEKCPCGSGRKYKKCCLNKEGVEMPHYKFILPKGFPPELQTNELSINT